LDCDVKIQGVQLNAGTRGALSGTMTLKYGGVQPNSEPAHAVCWSALGRDCAPKIDHCCTATDDGQRSAVRIPTRAVYFLQNSSYWPWSPRRLLFNS